MDDYTHLGDLVDNPIESVRHLYSRRADLRHRVLPYPSIPLWRALEQRMRLPSDQRALIATEVLARGPMVYTRVREATRNREILSKALTELTAAVDQTDPLLYVRHLFGSFSESLSKDLLSVLKPLNKPWALYYEFDTVTPGHATKDLSRAMVKNYREREYRMMGGREDDKYIIRKNGKVRHVFDVLIPFRKLKQIESVLHAIPIEVASGKAFKINVAYGTVRTNIFDGSVALPSADRMKYDLETTEMIHGPRDLEQLIEKVSDRIKNMAPEHAATLDEQATQSGFTYLGIFEVRFKISILPDTTFFNHTAGALNMSNSDFRAKFGLGVKQYAYCDGKDNMCLFQCVAQAYLRSVNNPKWNENYRTPTKEYFKMCYDMNPKNFFGVDLTNQKKLNEIGEKLKANLTVYQKDSEGVAQLMYSSTYKEGHMDVPMLQLLLPESYHLSLIIDVSNAFKSFVCKTCGMSFNDRSNYNKHINNPGACKVQVVKLENGQKRVEAIVNESFDHASMPVLPTESPMVGHNTLHDYFITWDIESWMKKETKLQDGKLKIAAVQQPLSVSFYNNFTNTCEHICEVDPEVLVSKFLDRVVEIADMIVEANFNKYGAVLNSCGDDKKKYSNIKQWLTAVSVVGYNTSGYDLIMLKKEIAGCGYDMPTIIQKGNKFTKLVMKTNSKRVLDDEDKSAAKVHLHFGDICSYLDRAISGTSEGEAKVKDEKPSGLAGYLNSWKTRVPKGVFPYEWLDDVKKLDATELPPYNCWYSSLKGCNISTEEHAEAQKCWADNGMKTMRDYLRHYNNDDVEPLHEAVTKHRLSVWQRSNIDFLTDFISLPGYAYNCLMQSVIGQIVNEPLKPAPQLVSDRVLDVKIRTYKVQDMKHNGTVLKEAEANKNDNVKHATILRKLRDMSNYKMTVTGMRKLLEKCNNRCYYCACGLNDLNFTMDRVDNREAHNEDRCLPCCANCNKGRSNNFTVADYKNLKKYEKHEDKLFWTFDEKNKEGFNVLRSRGMIGGPSIIMHRYHEAGVTQVSRPRYDHVNDKWYIEKGNTVQNIISPDETNQYPNALAQDMPTGKPKYEEVTTDERAQELLRECKHETFWGFLEVDAHIPKELYDYFSEWSPFYKNVNVPETEAVLGSYMIGVMKQNKLKNTNGRRLIGSYKVERYPMYAPCLNDFVKRGAIITKVYSAIHFKRGRGVCHKFVHDIADQRREADKDPSKQNEAEIAKMVGNSSVGRTIMDRRRHYSTSICNEKEYSRKIMSALYHDCEEYAYDDETKEHHYEVKMNKQKIEQDLPIQVGIAVYQLAKMHIMHFYYDFIDRFIDRKNFQLMLTDTDSSVIAICGNNLDDIVKPELRAEYQAEKHKWLAAMSGDVDAHGVPIPKEVVAYELRTPGLFKNELKNPGHMCIALCSKLYYIEDVKGKNKYSQKGCNKKQNKATREKFETALKSGMRSEITNRGIRYGGAAHECRMVTYEQTKWGYSPIYPKRRVADDGVTCFPLLI